MLLSPRKEKKKKERDPINTHTVLFSKDVPADVPAVHTETDAHAEKHTFTQRCSRYGGLRRDSVCLCYLQ